MTNASGSALSALSDVLRYPAEGFADRTEAGLAALASSSPKLAGTFEPFAAFASARPIEELEELYTRTFDLNPAATLETGWHIYGERYERGEFLARMRALLAGHGVPEDGELPDHLRLGLILLERLDEKEAALLVSGHFLPAVRKITQAVEAGNPYRGVLLAVETALEARFAAPPPGENP